MSELHIDFETRSTVDLKKAGLHVYAAHHTTDIWCMGFAYGDEPVRLWKAGERSDHLCDYVADGGEVVAHNAQFEYTIWNEILHKRYGWPPLKREQMRCTMAQAFAMGLPGGLENACAALGLAIRKDMEGHALMMRMARPRTIDPLTWWDDEERRQRLYEYCKQDVEAERALDKRLMRLTPYERKVWQLDQEINERGIYVDADAANRAVSVINTALERSNEKMHRVTGGAVSRISNVGDLTNWIRSQGVPTDGVAKSDVADLLEKSDLPTPVREALQIRVEAGKSSTAKLIAMLSGIAADTRARGMFQYHGASTGRWAGRRVQLQNLPRQSLEQDAIEDIVAHLDHDYIESWYGPPIQMVSECLRAFLTAAPGHDLIAADFANIEGRVLAWMAGEEWKLEAFRDQDAHPGDKSKDLYNIIYARSFGVPMEKVGKFERSVGKVEELALGYQGGVGAFQAMARGYGVKLPDDKVEALIHGWRKANLAIVRYWYQIQDAAIAAVDCPGEVFTVKTEHCAISYKKVGSFLWCRLPSGRSLCYPYPAMKNVVIELPGKRPFTVRQLHYMAQNSVTNRWEETATYGGSLVENITQAIARDLLADAMLRMDEWWEIVLHVHDEIVAEIPEHFPDNALEHFEGDMRRLPEWAAGLPVTAKGWRGKRYRKD